MEPLTALADWETFFAAEVGAAAALAGLLFVGVSLNLAKIISGVFLPLRGFLALLILVAILILASLLLIPGQTATVIGLEVVGIGGALWLAGTAIEVRGWRKRTVEQNPVTFLFNVALFEAATIPYLVGGALVLAGSAAGFYWVAVGMLLSFFKAVVDAWVLLVEINR